MNSPTPCLSAAVAANAPQQALNLIVRDLTGRGINCSYTPDGYLLAPGTGADGFDVLVFKNGTHFTICFDGLEERVSTGSEVIDWITRVHDAGFRLRTDFVGEQPRRWTLEQNDGDGHWQPVLGSGHVGWFRRGKALRTTYRKNACAASATVRAGALVGIDAAAI
jgi:hypothetical protein